jgi:hypothetical protein
VISTGVPTAILKVEIVAPVVAQVNVIGVELRYTPLQSLYTTSLIRKLSCPTHVQVRSDPIMCVAFAPL